ncbi:threonine synthase [Clostridia bacterium]|nr:threonine synthase [Clostridia bacterium]
MTYKSTRDSNLKITSAEAIARGISAEGGLFLPEEIPTITLEEIKEFSALPYSARATKIFKKFLTDFTDEEIEMCTKNAYSTKNFETENITEIAKLDNKYLLELWHGKTCAFKDMALQILPYLLVVSAKKLNISKEIVILVATSGDTGKAALEGFKDIKGTRIIVFYPEDGVSPMQKKQMITQYGDNVLVCAVKGNFDDCQNGVKAIFADKDTETALSTLNCQLSSANSINWGRLAPQIIYYISAYADLIEKGEIADGEKINIVVPTGNFGNILAAYYAKKMGLPINKLICASNKNKILTDFLSTGVYDCNREFYTTSSPSMDILISSNLERLLYLLSDDESIKNWFDQLKKTGKYQVNSDVLNKLQEEFYGGFCDDKETQDTIKSVFKEYNYLADTHTAVGIKVYDDYVSKTDDKTKTLIASTANPYKFSQAVLQALGGNISADEFTQIEEIENISNLTIPKSLADLKEKSPIYKDIISKDDMKNYVLNYIKSSK